MSTRSLICQKIDEKYETIYCHRGGNPSYLWDILVSYYTEESSVNQLIQNDIDSISYYDKHDYPRIIPTKKLLDRAVMLDRKVLLKRAYDWDVRYIYIFTPFGMGWHLVDSDNPLLMKDEE